jgi:dipeptidyl aminopeptidase/acylaminoacyl peptidase
MSTKDIRRYSIETFLESTDYQGASFSPDNRSILVSSDETGIFNTYLIPVDGGEAQQLTHSDDNAIFAVSTFPGDDRILYTSDEGGNERNHLYVCTADGDVNDLTPGETLKAGFLDWSWDQRTLLVLTNERNPRYFDLYEIACDGYGRQLLYQNEAGYDPVALSPDRQSVLLAKPDSNQNSDIYLYDRKTGTLRHLTPHEGDVRHLPLTFTPDGTALLYLTNAGDEFLYLIRYDLATNEHTVLLKADWDVGGARFSKQGTYLIVTINNDARTELRLYRWPELELVTLPDMEGAGFSSVVLSWDERKLAFYSEASSSPRDLYVCDVGATTAKRLTRALNPAIDPAHLVPGCVVRFASYDGVEIPGILYTPHTASAGNKGPAVLWVHGGPGGQSRLVWNPLIQYLVNHDYVVYAINNRGSSGYGKTFFQMDDRKHGDADLDDCVASKGMLVETGVVAPDRIGITGQSYGGYMVLAALAFRPRAFALGVDMFGISNWVRTLRSIPPWWESMRKALYTEIGDPDDGTFLHDKSPLFFAEQIERPLMVLQGANDPRVLKEESDEIVAAVKANSVPVEYVLFTDEGHGFVKRENQIRGYEAMKQFLERHL